MLESIQVYYDKSKKRHGVRATRKIKANSVIGPYVGRYCQHITNQEVSLALHLWLIEKVLIIFAWLQGLMPYSIETKSHYTVCGAWWDKDWNIVNVGTMAFINNVCGQQNQTVCVMEEEGPIPVLYIVSLVDLQVRRELVSPSRLSREWSLDGRLWNAATPQDYHACVYASIHAMLLFTLNVLSTGTWRAPLWIRL